MMSTVERALEEKKVNKWELGVSGQFDHEK